MADFLTTALGTSEVAHALKAPLITMAKALELLRDPSSGALTDTQRKFLTIAERNLELVTHLLGDFLDLAKLDAGTMRLLRKPGAVDTIVRQVVEEAQPAAAAKGVPLIGRIADGLPPAAFDPARLAQALAALLRRALALTPATGTVTVEVKPHDPWVEILIITTGAGLPPDTVAHLFDRRLPTADSASVKEMDFGAALAKGIVELHQGRLSVVSDGGVGATWTVSLPVEHGAAGDGRRTGPTRILLVDDEPDFRETLAAWLRARQYEVYEAGRGDEALALVRRTPVEVVFLDLHLPPTDGLDVLAKIRQTQRDLPVIMITADPNPRAIAKARQLGISGFFPKEGGLQELTAVIEVALRRHKGL